MPAAAAAYVVEVLAVEGIAAVVAYAAVYVAVTYVIALGVQKVFGKKPGGGGGADFSGRLTTIKQPVVPRRMIYGRARVGGVIVFAHSSSAQDINTRSEAFVIPPAPHQVTVTYAPISVLSVRFVVYEDDGSGTGGFTNIYTPATAVGGSPTAGQYAVSGSAFTFAAADAGRNVEIAYTANTTNYTDVFLHLVVVLAAHEVDAIEAVYFDDTEVPIDGSGNVTGGRFQNYARVYRHLGAADQVADTALIAESAGLWTENDRLRGHAYLYLRLIGHSTVYANGVPNITAIVRGRKDIYDPRTSTSGYSANAALCAANYIGLAGAGLGANIATEFDSASLIAAANICDEDVALAAGGTEKRYTCHGVIDTSAAHEENLNNLLSAMGGRAVWSMGKWYIGAAAYVTPTVTLDEGDARGNIKVLAMPSRREQFNAVKGVFAPATALWQPADYPPVTNATYQAQDGERLWRELDLPFTTSATMAQRIAKIELERQRQGITCIYPARLGALVLQAGDTVQVSNERFGWFQKVFEVQKWEFVQYEDDSGAPALGVDLTLRETASGVFSWNSGLETAYDLSPNTSLPDASVVSPPGNIAVTESLYETREGGGVKTRVNIVLTPAADGRAHQYQYEYKALADGQFTVAGWSRADSFELLDMAAGVYDFRAKSISALGASSIYRQVRKEIIGLGAAPADVTGLTLQAVSSLVVLQWDRHPDLDVRRGGKLLIRHSESTSTPPWEDSYSIVEAVSGDATSAVVPLKAGTYLVKAEDAGGNQSVNAVRVITKASSLFLFAAVAGVTEDPAFTGAKTSTQVADSALQLAQTSLIDSVASIDALTSVDAGGPTAASGTYVFANRIDLVTVSRVQLRMELAMSTVQTSTLIDNRTLTVDDWSDWDGSLGGGVGDCVIEVRETDGNPAASPTWSAWRRLVTADYTARAFEFRALLSVSDPAYNVYVTKLRVGAFAL